MEGLSRIQLGVLDWAYRTIPGYLNEKYRELEGRLLAANEKAEHASKLLSERQSSKPINQASDLTYVVSGAKRSGTSMLMRCCELGGMQVDKNPDADTGEEVNKYGNYEMTGADWGENGAWHSHMGKVVKKLYIGIYGLPRDIPFKVCFMLRHPEAVRQSADAVLDGRGALENGHYFVDVLNAIQFLSQRPNVDLTILRYEAVLLYPHQSFKMLCARGWPLDVAMAATGVEPELCRYATPNLSNEQPSQEA